MIYGNTKLNQLNVILQIPDITSEELKEVEVEISQDYLKFSAFLSEF